jgi:hypothetical protein
MLPSLQTSNLMFTSLLLPFNDSYHLVAKGVFYSIDYHREWECIKKNEELIVNIAKLYVILI